MRPRMLAQAGLGEAFALATIAAADGGGPRGPGAQMFVTADEAAGFLSGGCIEADVIVHARAALGDGKPRRLVYGRGSPYTDVRLPCGGRLDVLVERIDAGDAAMAELGGLTEARRPAFYLTDGVDRRCSPGVLAVAEGQVGRTYLPGQRLIVLGSDPFALAIAGLGAEVGWETTLVRPKGPAQPPPLAIGYDRRAPGEALEAMALDPWTAVAVASHDLDLDHEALAAALRSEAGYVGVLGSRRRLAERQARLAEAGVTPQEFERLRAPIGLDIGSRAPWEVAVSVVGEIIAARRHAG